MPRRVARTQDDIEVGERDLRSRHGSVRDADQNVESAGEEVPEKRPVGRSKRNATTKSKSKTSTLKQEKVSRSRVRQDMIVSDEETEDVPFDREVFLATARPISDKSVDAIGGLARDWKELRHQVQNVGFTLVTDTAIAVAEVSGDTEEGEEAIEELDSVMRKLIDAEQELTAQEASLTALKAKASTGEIINKLEDEYAAHVQDAMYAYNRRTSRQKYAKHSDYFKFRDRVWEVNHEDAMPPVNDLIPREDGDSDAQSDIEIGGITQDYRCPLTLTHLTDPLTSKLCNHSFSANAIKEYLRGTRGRGACPASGCSAMLSLADLVPNKELAKRAADAARRAKRREEQESDDNEDEVVD